MIPSLGAGHRDSDVCPCHSQVGYEYSCNDGRQERGEVGKCDEGVCDGSEGHGVGDEGEESPVAGEASADSAEVAEGAAEGAGYEGAVDEEEFGFGGGAGRERGFDVVAVFSVIDERGVSVRGGGDDVRLGRLDHD